MHKLVCKKCYKTTRVGYSSIGLCVKDRNYVCYACDDDLRKILKSRSGLIEIPPINFKSV